MVLRKHSIGSGIFFGPWERAPSSLLKERGISAWAKGAGKKNTMLLIVPKGMCAPEPFFIEGKNIPSRLLVLVGEGASISVVLLSSGRPGTPLVVEQECHVAKSATVHWWNITAGGNISHRLEIDVAGANARAEVRWIFHAQRSERQELSASVRYGAPGGRGETIIRGVVEDQASVVSRGVIEIASKGRGTETFLSDHVLLLDPKAQARAVPKLKIETNDVKASHSASVSRIHPEDLFYMMSRGISKEEAREMYVEGFLAELLEGISGSGLRGRLRGNL